MKKQLLFALCVISLLCACSNKANKKEVVLVHLNKMNTQKADSLEKLAEASTENISELPLKFSFSMSEDEVNKHIEDLIKNKLLKRIGEDYIEYSYTTKNGVKVEYILKFSCFENRLYHLQLNVPMDDREENIYTAIDEDLNSKIDSTYKRISYWYDHTEFKEKYFYTNWFKGNQIIEFQKFYPIILGAKINYYNAPLHKIASDAEMGKFRDESNARIRMIEAGVENSTYDGSVSKVEAYLKSNLKDVSSYQSIEWSIVTPTDNGYMVRHKYRAKNSFGAYELVNQVFYLNGNGEVIGVSDYK